MGVSFKVSKTGARYRPKPQANDGAVVADDEPESNSKESSRKQQVTKKKKKKVMWSELNSFDWLLLIGSRENVREIGEVGNWEFWVLDFSWVLCEKAEIFGFDVCTCMCI